MGFIDFPSELTEEERLLQANYAKLRRKKREFRFFKGGGSASGGRKLEPGGSADKGRPGSDAGSSSSLKRTSDAKDAKEVAKKLIRSGAIQAIAVPKDPTHQVSFKRSSGLERKLAEAAPARQIADGGEYIPNTKRGEKKRGNTIHVFGYNITEELLKKHFSHFGKMLNISMEPEKNCGFITFASTESADRSIQQLNGSMVAGIQIKVSLARRQPVIEHLANNEPSSSTWSAIAASKYQKGLHRDKRQSLTSYDDLPLAMTDE
ncbi:unnamed protein product [Cyprideis torosa]|uniref:Negative elongation factor E n=1 Tax=Cyprideis torosa TaxID=163714 RepID=A0A7R8WIT4_9CRUS|nr:unnamed protein product [Cyprideis torosa]CAG0895039.1 unnamed protein product [Cyprideis torosa]